VFFRDVFGRVPATKRTVSAEVAQPAQGLCIGFERARHQDPAAMAIRRAQLHRILQPQMFFCRQRPKRSRADFKFQSSSVTTAGSCRDSTAFAASGLDQCLSIVTCLPDGFWVAADDAERRASECSLRGRAAMSFGSEIFLTTVVPQKT